MSHTTKLLEVLHRHIGCEHGVPVHILAPLCGMSEREVRATVTLLRQDGVGVCAHPAKGYFIAASETELQKYCIDFLEHRALHSLKVCSKLRRLELPEYIGQLQLRS